jgi:hypothetical protein
LESDFASDLDSLFDSVEDEDAAGVAVLVEAESDEVEVVLEDELPDPDDAGTVADESPFLPLRA